VHFENSDYGIYYLIIAQRARKDLNGEVLVPKYSQNVIGKPIRICKYEGKNQMFDSSKDNKKNLLVKNIDPSISAKEFSKMFQEFGDIKSCKLEVDEHGASKGYGYVNYVEETHAELAKQKLVKIICKYRTEKK
jgi:polyadenylate-binding protein